MPPVMPLTTLPAAAHQQTPASWRRKAGSSARVAAAGAMLLACQLPAQADWSATVSTQTLDLGLYVATSSGNYSWTTVQEGWGTTFASNGGIPNEFQFQTWDGVAWQQSNFGGSIVLPGGGQSVASWSHDDVQLEANKSGYVSVFGALANGQSSGAFVLHDFRLVLQPFATVEITYHEDEYVIDLSHDAGDQGVAFGQVKLFGHTLDLDVPGGANQPYFQGLLSLSGGAVADTASGSAGTQSYTFSNATGQAQTFNLRFEASALVFTTPPVPEPQTWALWLAGLALLGATARRRSRQG